MNEFRETLVLLGLAWNSCRDFRVREVHLPSVAVLALAGILLRILEGFSFTETVLGISPGLLMLGISVVTRGALGAGDGLMTISLGLCLGFAQTAEALLTALFSSAAWAGIQLCFRHRKGKDSLPFIPFLLFGNMGRLIL